MTSSRSAVDWIVAVFGLFARLFGAVGLTGPTYRRRTDADAERVGAGIRVDSRR